MIHRNSYAEGFRGDTSTGSPGSGMSIGNMSTQSSILPEISATLSFRYGVLTALADVVLPKIAQKRQK